MTHRLIYNDSSHAYYLDGKRCKSVTTVAKIAPDNYALTQWQKRQVAIGFTLEPRLIERVAVDVDNKELVDGVCEEAFRVAGAHRAAERGTQRHRASEIFDTGGDLITGQQRADAEAWQRTIDHHDIEILPHFVEGFAIYPEFGIAGRFDRIVKHRGRHRLLDLKSGKNAVLYPQSTSVQLALYARAPFISKTISTAGDRSTVEDWQAPPDDLDLDIALVILLSDDMKIGELWEIDIAHGWLGAELALNIVNWRKGRDYGKELSRKVAGFDLAGLIGIAGDVESLGALWKEYRSMWTEEHTELARKRKAELEAMHKLVKQHESSPLLRKKGA